MGAFEITGYGLHELLDIYKEVDRTDVAEEESARKALSSALEAIVMKNQVDVEGCPGDCAWGDYADTPVDDSFLWKRSRFYRPDDHETINLKGGTVMGTIRDKLFVVAGKPSDLAKSAGLEPIESGRRQWRGWMLAFGDITSLALSSVLEGSEREVEDNVTIRPLTRIELHERIIATNVFIYDNPFGPDFQGYGYGMRH